MVESYWWWVGGGLQHFSVSPRPLGFGFWGFGAKGLVPGLNNISDDKLHELIFQPFTLPLCYEMFTFI